VRRVNVFFSDEEAWQHRLDGALVLLKSMCLDRCENWGAIVLAPHAQRCRKSGRAHAKAADTEVGLAHS